MKVGILGHGQVGQALASLFSIAGHDAIVGVRHPSDDRAKDGDRVASLNDAVDHGDLVVLAIPFSACGDLLPRLAARLAGKVLVDVTNPLNPDWSPRSMGPDDSGGERIARMVPDATVVKAFNTIFADTMSPAGRVRGGHPISAFVAGDLESANTAVASLAADAGFTPIQVGPLRMARYLEAMAHLNIHIAVGLGRGTQSGFVYL